MDREYFRSERAIWDNLKTEVVSGLPSLYETWKTMKKVDPFIISWPGEPILDEKGLPIKGKCLLDLPTNKSSWGETIGNFAKRTKAYALLLTEQKEREVLVTLESHHGTRSWAIPILASGDVRFLGEPVVKDDTHSIGVLWRTRRAAS